MLEGEWTAPILRKEDTNYDEQKSPSTKGTSRPQTRTQGTGDQRVPQTFERRPDREGEEQEHVGRERHSQMAIGHHALALHEHHRRVYTFGLRKYHMYVLLLLLLL